MLTDEATIALCDFNRIIQEMGLICLIVGAGARLLTFEWQYEVPVGRGTTDWDFGAKVENWSEYEDLSQTFALEIHQYFARIAMNIGAFILQLELHLILFLSVLLADRTIRSLGLALRS